MLHESLERLLRMRFALPLVLVGAGLLLLVSEASYNRATQAAAEAVMHRKARDDMRAVLQALTDAETAQRGYVLTGSDDSLRPHERALRELPERMAAVQAYLKDQGRPQDATDLRKLVEARMSEVQTTIELRRQQRTEAAIAVIQAGIGQDQMDEVRRVIDVLERRANAELDRARSVLVRVLLLNRLGIGFLAVAFVLGLYFTLRQVRLLDATRAGQRHALETERARLEDEVGNRTADLRELASHLQSAREDERASLARELHDELGALLTAAKLDVARLRSKLTAQPEQLARLAHLTQTLNEGIALKRRIIEDLRPSSLSNLGLVTALEILCQQMAERLGVPIQTRLEPLQVVPPADLTVFRIVQESLTNIAKYAAPASVQVSLRRKPSGQVEVEVADDGVGFEPAKAHVGRHGLQGMRFRVESAGGQMWIESAPGQGTRVRVELPASLVKDAQSAQDVMAPAAGEVTLSSPPGVDAGGANRPEARPAGGLRGAAVRDVLQPVPAAADSPAAPTALRS